MALRQAQGPPTDRAVALNNAAGCNRADTYYRLMNVLGKALSSGERGWGIQQSALYAIVSDTAFGNLKVIGNLFHIGVRGRG